jgi:hypothetical protein
MKNSKMTKGDLLANKMNVELNVFGAVVMNWILGQVDGRDVVAENNRRLQGPGVQLV